ncbi:MAG TPA: hypothetical protein VJV39_06515 [Dongiaceae bacterium]|nr:hypothetical protein [Dongiaceae bacterium]
MTSGERQGPALEIIQMRDIAVGDRRDLTRLWEKLARRKSFSRLYTAFFYLWYAFAAFLTVSIWMAARRLNTVDPDLALQLVVAALGFAISLVGAHWVGRREAWSRYWTALQVGDRYALVADSLHWSTARGVHSWRLDKMDTVINDDRRLVALLPHGGGVFVVKSAFESRDVESFAAELIRRWQALRALSGASA